MLKPVNLTWGTDPEGFLTRNGRVIGSEKVIPAEGIGPEHAPYVVRDGVQFELNPAPCYKPLDLGTNIAHGLSTVSALAKKNGAECYFGGVVSVDRAELDSLSPKSRVLGCMPSLNIYGDKPIKVNPKTYRKRSAGGHIHIGLTGHSLLMDHESRQRLVPLLDIFVGNTGVLLDRDPGAAERRQNYGRAGEYRIPKHGLEYRTPSNFWLLDYSLMSLMFGLAHTAVSVMSETLMYKHDLEQELVDTIDIRTVIQAIDGNDWGLARKNFESLLPFISKYVPVEPMFPVNKGNVDQFLKFTDGVLERGLAHYFPGNPVERWQGAKAGFNEFLYTTQNT